VSPGMRVNEEPWVPRVLLGSLAMWVLWVLRVLLVHQAPLVRLVLQVVPLVQWVLLEPRDLMVDLRGPPELQDNRESQGLRVI
jgi:hypothetical protein